MFARHSIHRCFNVTSSGRISVPALHRPNYPQQDAHDPQTVFVHSTWMLDRITVRFQTTVATSNGLTLMVYHQMVQSIFIAYIDCAGTKFSNSELRPSICLTHHFQDCIDSTPMANLHSARNRVDIWAASRMRVAPHHCPISDSSGNVSWLLLHWSIVVTVNRMLAKAFDFIGTV